MLNQRMQVEVRQVCFRCYPVVKRPCEVGSEIVNGHASAGKKNYLLHRWDFSEVLLQVRNDFSVETNLFDVHSLCPCHRSHRLACSHSGCACNSVAIGYCYPDCFQFLFDCGVCVFNARYLIPKRGDSKFELSNERSGFMLLVRTFELLLFIHRMQM